MPGEAGAEDGRVEGVAGHGVVVGVHEMAVEVLILGEEAKAEQADVEIGVDVDNRIVAYEGGALHAEL